MHHLALFPNPLPFAAPPPRPYTSFITIFVFLSFPLSPIYDFIAFWKLAQKQFIETQLVAPGLKRFLRPRTTKRSKAVPHCHVVVFQNLQQGVVSWKIIVQGLHFHPPVCIHNGPLSHLWKAVCPRPFLGGLVGVAGSGNHSVLVPKN